MRGRGVGRPALLAMVVGGAVAAAVLARCWAEREPPLVDAPARAEMLAETLRWSDGFWDEREGLLTAPPQADRPGHLVRESVWYADGLLEARRPGDVERAVQILARVAGLQMHAPGQDHDGTFPRTTEEPPPVRTSTDRTYDPNWREFLGSAMALALVRHGELLPAPLRSTLWTTVRLAARSEPRPAGALATNVALMHAFTLTAVAAHDPADGDLRTRGEAILDAALADARRYGTVREHNSPTYYGVDLYAATLLARYGATAAQRRGGCELVGLLWADVVRRYSPTLRNECGPYSRAYGIDMTRYVALLGLWIWAETDRAHAPIPASEDAAHDHDRFEGPLIASVALDVGPDVRDALVTTPKPHLVEQTLAGGDGTSRCWIEDRVMIGGLDGTPGKQSYPVTMHWRASQRDTGWLVAREGVVRAVAATRRVDVIFASGATFEISPSVARIEGDRWELAGLTLRVGGGCVFRRDEVPGGLRVSAPQCTEVSLQVIDDGP